MAAKAHLRNNRPLLLGIATNDALSGSATNIAKLMSDVTPEDILSIANTVSDFIRNHEIGGDNSTEETSTEDIDEPINFDIDTEEGEE